jgi:hypothetical protein
MLLHLASSAAACGLPIATSNSQLAFPLPCITLLWSVRTLQDVFLLPQLRALASSAAAAGSDSALAGRLRLVITVTRHLAGHHTHGLHFDTHRDNNESSMSVHDVAGRLVTDAEHAGGMRDVLLQRGRITPHVLRRLTHSRYDTGSSSSSCADNLSASLSGTSDSGNQHALICGPPSMTESPPCLVAPFAFLSSCMCAGLWRES